MSDAKNPYREYSGTMPIADPVADIWDQGAKAGAETERAAVVAWLRSPEAKTYAGDIRDAIEAGEHLDEAQR